MGTIHKLKPEVLDFIIEQKKNNPALSCRTLTVLISDNFKIEISKSSINTVMKEVGLSAPVGRTLKKKKRSIAMPSLPALLEYSPKKELQVQVDLRVEEKLKIEEEARRKEMEKLKVEAELAESLKEELVKKAQAERIKEAEEWAIKLQEEERIRINEKLSLEKQKLKDEDAKIKAEEIAKKTEQDRLAKEAKESARQAEEEKKRLEEEAVVRAEKEKWARLAEEELKQLTAKADVSIQKNEIKAQDLLSSDGVCSGAILLKAVDCLIGGSKQINEIICKSTLNPPEDFLALTEMVIFRSLFGKENFAGLCSLAGQQVSQERIDNYYLEIKQIKDIKLDVAKIILNAFTEVRGVKVQFIDESNVYLDGQLHTIWTTPYLPYDFSRAVYGLKNNLNKHFFQAQPLVLLSAGGYDVPTKEFFNLLLNISSPNNGLSTLILYGHKLEELQNIPLNLGNRYALVFGLWPWQFTTYRKVKRIGNFNSAHIASMNKDLYLAEIEVDLLRPATNQSITLEGCAIKLDLKEKIRVVILSSDRSLVNLHELAQLYLSHWPNLEEGFGDFNRKVEVFTYTGSTQKFFSTENLGLSMMETSLELEEIFANYIKVLDAYLRWYFLSSSYQSQDFLKTQERFYNLTVKINKVNDKNCLANFVLPAGYAFSQDLNYALRRLNESQVILPDGLSLYLNPG